MLGVAAVVGLAVVSALYVSHAREVKRLREWAGRAPERWERRLSAVAGHAAGAPPPAQPQVRRAKRSYRRIGTHYVAVALGGLLVLGAAAYGVIQLTGGDNSGRAREHGVPDKPRRNVAAVKPGNVTVAVLNGTTVPGLAAALSAQVAAAGFKKGMINNFSDQQLAESVVQYAPGHQAEANAVSRSVGISRREPVAANTRALAGDAAVIVIAGVDKAP